MNDPKAGGSSQERPERPEQDQGSSQEKESFIGQEDRPETRIDPEKPVAELRVRELAQILGSSIFKPVQGEKPKLEKFEKFEKIEKFEIKEFKPEKFEKPEFKELKREKFEKPEFKELKREKYEKLEKIERDPVKYFFEPNIPFDPGQFEGPVPDPWREVVQVVTGLQQQVSQLANQVAELQRKISG